MVFSWGGVAKEKLSSAQVRMKHLYQRKTEQRSFGPGGQVLVLLQRSRLPFLEKHSGLFHVLGQGTDQNSDDPSTPLGVLWALSLSLF